MKVYNHRLPAMVHGAALLNASDVPASRKMQGAAAHSHMQHPCNYCFIAHADISTAKGYDTLSTYSLHYSQKLLIYNHVPEFILKDDFVQLSAAERS